MRCALSFCEVGTARQVVRCAGENILHGAQHADCLRLRFANMRLRNAHQRMHDRGWACRRQRFLCICTGSSQRWVGKLSCVPKQEQHTCSIMPSQVSPTLL